ncbi:MAG: hypothetical protein HDS71_00845 [Bacteroidales bacterium]|nr:hypothetical protein [Bacteroidales bacterium]
MKNLLKALNVVYTTDIQSKFHDIAENLMYNYIIKKGESSYAIVEIEFYYHSPYHPDIITYPRNLRGGRWFFHQSGVDLTFDSESTILDKNGSVTNSKDAIFGGILIRGLYDIDTHVYTFGPQKCVNLLWQDLGASSELDGYPTLERVPEGVIQRHIQEYRRCINIEQDKEIDKVKEWAKRVGKKVDDMLESDLKKEFDKIINVKYRFFNLQNGENPTSFTKIPAKARP